jgi:hypothetical protein
VCGKYVCDRHARQLSASDQADMAPTDQVAVGAVVCVECVKQRVGQTQTAGRWTDDPYFWGMYHMAYYRPYSLHDQYDQRDHAAFEQADAGGSSAAYESDLSGT